MDDRDQTFADLVAERKLASREQVDGCAEIVRKAEAIGAAASLPDTMVAQGVVSREQADALLAELEGRGAKLTALGGFELIERIGSGAMGVVYKARQVAMDRVVALKVLKPSLSRNATFVERFLREARAAARLSHPNVVRGIDAGHDHGFHYFAMEFVDGPTVAQRLRDHGVIAEAEALRITRDVASALVEAEERGIIHRDIKPGNLMLTRKGAAKLADLGLARRSDAEGTLTLEGSAMGTPHYMSPEQARGERDVDVRSDIYALGATLFHMATGTTPFSGDTPAIIVARRLSEPTPNPRERAPGLSLATCRLILRMMDADRDKRFQTAQELLDAVEAARRGEVPAAPATPRPAARKRRAPRRHHPHPTPRARRSNAAAWTFAGIGGLVLLIVIVAIASRRGSKPGDADLYARSAFQNAEAHTQRHPNDLNGAIAAYQAVRTQHPNTEWATLAANRITGLQRRKTAQQQASQQLQAALTGLRKTIASHVTRDRFGDALAAVDAFARKHPSAGAATADLKRDVLSKANARYAALARAADEALAANDCAKARAALQPALAFGIDALTAKAKAKLADIEKRAAAGKWTEWVDLFDGKTLKGWRVPDEGVFARHGRVGVDAGRVLLEPGKPKTAIAWDGEFPTDNYELAVEAMRTAGRGDFCDIIFPAGTSQSVLYVGGWDGGTVGLTLDDLGANNNASTRHLEFGNGRWYHLRLQVTQARIRFWVDGQPVIDLDRSKHKLNQSGIYAPLKSLGLQSHDTSAALRNIRLRRVRSPRDQTPAAPAGEGWKSLFDGKTLEGWRAGRRGVFAGAGKVHVKDGAIVLERGKELTAIALTRRVPSSGYEIAYDAMCTDGHQFASLIFPYGQSHARWYVSTEATAVDWTADDGPGQTRRPVELKPGTWHRCRLRVGRHVIEAWINDERVVSFDTRTRPLKPGWDQWCVDAGGGDVVLFTGSAAAAYRNIRLRRLELPDEAPTPRVGPGKWVSLFDGKTLDGWGVLKKGFQSTSPGKALVEKGSIVLTPGRPRTSIGLARPFPLVDYELSLEFMRITGDKDFLLIEFPLDARRCTLWFRGWLGMITTIANLDGKGENITSRKIHYEAKRWYKLHLKVTGERVVVLLDDKPIIDLATAGYAIIGRGFPVPLVISAWHSTVGLRNIRARSLRDGDAEDTPGLEPGEWTKLFDGTSLRGWKVSKGEIFEGHGRVAVKSGQVALERGKGHTGIAWGGKLPDQWELDLEAMRVAGGDVFCQIVFPVGQEACEFTIGGWSNKFVAINEVDARRGDNNVTTRRMSFDTERWYPIRVRYRRGRIQAWIQREKVLDFPTAGHSLATRRLLPGDAQLALCTVGATGAFRNIRLRPLRPALPPAEGAAAGKWTPLFDGNSLKGWRLIEAGGFAKHGKVAVGKGSILLDKGDYMTGVVLEGKPPAGSYELTLEAARLEGTWDFCMLCFPIGDAHCVWKIGGGTGQYHGLGMVDGKDFQHNLTSGTLQVERGRWYKIAVRVTEERVQGWIDGAAKFDVPRAGHVFSVFKPYQPMVPLAVASWGTRAAIRGIRVRPLSKPPDQGARPVPKAMSVAAYTKQSDELWDLLHDCKAAEAVAIAARLKELAPPELPAARVEADVQAARAHQGLWATVEKALAGKIGGRITVAGTVGTIRAVRDGVVTIRSEGAEFPRRITQLDPRAALDYAEVGEDEAGQLTRALVLLATRCHLDEAAKALAAAGGDPTIPIYRDRLAKLRTEAAEAAARKAWEEVKSFAGPNLTPPRAKRLGQMLEAFDRAFAETAFGKSVAAEVVKLRAEAEKAANPPPSLQAHLNDFKQWQVNGGTWRAEAGGIVGSGDSKLTFKHKLPAHMTLSFRINVKSGMRPRMHLRGSGFYLGNEGFQKLLALHGSGVTKTHGKPFSYVNNREYEVSITLDGEKVLVFVNDQVVAAGKRKTVSASTLMIQAGDGWSKGTVRYSRFRLVDRTAGQRE